MMLRPLFACLITLGALALPLDAAAEGSGHPEGTAPDAPVTVKRAKPKPKALPKAPPPALPVAPVPYETYSGTGAPTHSPDPGHMPQPVTPASAPVAAAPIQAAPVLAEALPTPVVVVTAPTSAPPTPPLAPAEISLKCDTRLTRDKKLVSSGTFYVDIFPSPVFPDELASFQFRFADPNHDSLIRESLCVDTRCSAPVSGAAYALVNKVTKKGNALRITLDRTKGAFYAEAIHGGRHLGEQGWCTVQPLPAAQF